MSEALNKIQDKVVEVRNLVAELETPGPNTFPMKDIVDQINARLDDIQTLCSEG